jgi:CspA family cold shock protein
MEGLLFCVDCGILGLSKQYKVVGFKSRNGGTVLLGSSVHGSKSGSQLWYLFLDHGCDFYLKKHLVTAISKSADDGWVELIPERSCPMEKGTVKWFNGTKGYGFIKRSNGEDVFVHYNAIEGQGFRTLNEGDQVQFEVQQGPKGLQATKVSLAQ